MNQSVSAALETAATDDSTDLKERDVRALTEYLTVLSDIDRVAGAEDMYLVVSQSGKEYLVDTRTGACECPDAEYRNPEGGCKHLRRAQFAAGGRDVPTWIADDVAGNLGEHVNASPRKAVADGGMIVADDDGEILDESDENDSGRPEDCSCWNADGDLACWACYREGFEAPNPHEPGVGESEG